jgi:hypothetical protein
MSVLEMVVSEGACEGEGIAKDTVMRRGDIFGELMRRGAAMRSQHDRESRCMAVATPAAEAGGFSSNAFPYLRIR